MAWHEQALALPLLLTDASRSRQRRQPRALAHLSVLLLLCFPDGLFVVHVRLLGLLLQFFDLLRHFLVRRMW